MNKKPPAVEDPDNNYILKKSGGSCLLEDIEGFTFGSNQSRFEILKKQINSFPVEAFTSGKVPFLIWQCISF
jgi:hypothetical protein